MSQIDFEDMKQLGEMEELIEEVSNDLSNQLNADAELEIILTDQLLNYDIKSQLSQKNKFIELKRLTRDEHVCNWVDDWMRSQAKIKSLRIRLNQVQGKRDSLKKRISTLPS